MSCILTAMVGTTTHTLVSLFHHLPRVGVMCQVLDLSTAEKGDDTPLQLEGDSVILASLSPHP